MVAKGLIDPAAPRRRHRRTKAEIEAEAALLPPGSNAKRRRGRPRKADAAAEEVPEGAAAGEEAAEGGAEGGSAAKPRKRRKKAESAPTPTLDPTLVGQPVTGVLDGCFDAGYLLTVRVGDSDVMLRGVLFGPGLIVPVTKNNDIAPDVKFVKQDETIVLPPSSVAPAPPPSLLPPETLVAGSGAAGERVVEAVTAAAPAVKAEGAAAVVSVVEGPVRKTEDVAVQPEVAAPTPLPDVTMAAAAATVSPQQDSGKQGFGVTPSGFSTSGSASFSSDSARPVHVQMGA